MAIKKHDRQYDLVVFGATGYTGQMTAEHITTHLPTDLKWAVAGRSQSKLQAVVDECQRTNPDRLQPAIEIANVDSDEELANLAKKTYVLITTVGPYSRYGETALKACAQTGTHYLDVTGEFPWVARMIKKYEKTAQNTGALLFPQIGVESAPPDLCTWALAKGLREELGAKTKDAIISIHTLKGAPSGGTLASVFNVFDSFSLAELQASGRHYAMSPIPRQGRGRPRRTLFNKIFGSRQVPHLGLLTSSVAAVTDTTVIERTWGLLSVTPGRENEFYGPNFTWVEYYRARSWLNGVVIHLGLMLGGFLLIFPFVRALAKMFVYQPGQGPEKEASKREEIEYRGTATPDDEGRSGKKAYCRVKFNGSIYYLTGVLAAQAALTLLEEDVGLGGGMYTAACLGQPFIDRAAAAGFNLETRIIDI